MDKNRERKTERQQDCARIRASLSAFLDDDLDHDAHRAMQRHLDACATCRSEWNQHRKAEQLLQVARQTVPESGDLRAGFYARLAATPPLYRPSLGTMLRSATVPALAMSALAIALLIIAPRWLFPQQSNIAGSPTPNISKIVDAPGAPPSHLLAERTAPSNPRQDIRADRRIADNSVSVAQSGHGGDNKIARSGGIQRSATMIAAAGVAVPIVRIQEIVRLTSRDGRLPQIKLPPFKPIGNVAIYYERASEQTQAMALATVDDAFRVDSKSVSVLSKMAPSLTRADLMNEEVHIHIVNDKNEEVDSVHVAPETTTAANASVVHVEADANPESAGLQSETP